VLDVATGTGNIALRAAAAGAHVIGLDLTPELFETARRRAAEQSVVIDWIEGDAEELPFEDGRDRVLSAFGVQFAPHHEIVAHELARVTRPGGRIGLVNWTPTGQVGELFKIMGRYLPPPPDFASPPPLWGDEDHVRALLGDRVSHIETRKGAVTIEFPSPEAWLERWKQIYGPTVVTYRSIAADPERVAALDRALTAVATRFDRGAATTVLDWEYLILTADVPS
jgi:SAM-dependent methyltransferase